MKQQKLLKTWAGMYALCALLGFIPNPTGVVKFLLVVLSVGFFIPPAMLIYHSVQRKTTDTNMLRLIRNLSLLSLGGTLVALILNFLSVMWPVALGNALYGLLVIVSSPMICSQYWILSLFCWACLLMLTLRHLRRK